MNKAIYFFTLIFLSITTLSPNNETGTNHPAIRRGYHADWNNHIIYEYFEEKLNIASECGPIDHADITEEGYVEYWSATNRIIWPKQADNNYDEPKWYGEFSGLDYMLLHNLYWLSFLSDNRENVFIKTELPYEALYNGDLTQWIYLETGNKEKPVVIKANNTLKANNRILSNANVRYESENEIILLPGFETELGADFEAFIIEKHIYRKYNYISSCPDYPITYSSAFKETNSTIVIQNEKGIININNSNTHEENIENECLCYFDIFPNPGTGIYNLIINNDNLNNALIEVINISGLKVYSKIINSNFEQLDIQNQPAGIYIVKIIVDNKVYSSKIINKK